MLDIECAACGKNKFTAMLVEILRDSTLEVIEQTLILQCVKCYQQTEFRNVRRSDDPPESEAHA